MWYRNSTLIYRVDTKAAQQQWAAAESDIADCTAVCAAEMGVNLRQSRSAMPVRAHAARAIFSCDTDTMISQSVYLIFFK